MRIVIAPDKFKGCLSAHDVAAAIAQGVALASPDAQLDLCPVADGGEGTVAALVQATDGNLLKRPVTGPLPGMRVEATWGLLGDGQTAVIEMASASGLALLDPKQRNPLRTTTFGTGELLRAVAARGVKRIILGIGGSATVDGGIGAIQGAGGVIHLDTGIAYDADGRKLVGGDVGHVVRIDPPLLRNKSGPVDIIVACDVGNPLFGPDGAAPIFGPQKGATESQVLQLDQSLEQLARRTRKLKAAQTPGSGAAGGLGFAMLAFFDAQLKSGIEIVMDAANLRQRLAGADLCLTGEGRLDGQSAAGKVVSGVATLCKQLDVPCIALAGSIGPGAQTLLDQGLLAYTSIIDRPMTLDESIAQAAPLLTAAAQQLVRMRAPSI